MGQDQGLSIDLGHLYSQSGCLHLQHCEEGRNSVCGHCSAGCCDNMGRLWKHTGAQFDAVLKQTQTQDSFGLPSYPSELSISDEDHDGHSLHLDGLSGDGNTLPRSQGRGYTSAANVPDSILKKSASTNDESQQARSDHEEYVVIQQPETRPISQEQLISEVKGIYAGLVMVESKCIEVDNAPRNGARLNNEQWQALIALHRTLLHEHHDFFLASQHPSASPALRRLASKYAMPARMWRHGIHSFLELLRHRLPDSLEHMLTFIYLAYSMMALLYETVPAFEDTWIECLGDLGRYRMAIEDDDIRDREVWTAVSRHWYSRAADRAPTTGRLYHHLAILARPNALQQLFYYTKGLCVPIPFESARESIMSLFDPILGPNISRHPSIDVDFIKAHSLLFSGKKDIQGHAGGSDSFHHALRLSEKTHELVFSRLGDPNILPFMHTTLVFVYHLTSSPPETAFPEATFPWKVLSLHLNSLILSCNEFPRPGQEAAPCLPPEDFTMKGLIWTGKYYPNDWFLDDKIDDDEKYFEVASMEDERKERILWLGCHIAKWLIYDKTLDAWGIDDPISHAAGYVYWTIMDKISSWHDSMTARVRKVAISHLQSVEGALRSLKMALPASFLMHE
ncbi:hypothetical protein F4677DRAFT_52454 [Hypoxylon crocopeplum]|nr:hypothetical protein F4677DRAFT_52454 [Hypoxylon crocopeplum]